MHACVFLLRAILIYMPNFPPLLHLTQVVQVVALWLRTDGMGLVAAGALQVDATSKKTTMQESQTTPLKKPLLSQHNHSQSSLPSQSTQHQHREKRWLPRSVWLPPGRPATPLPVRVPRPPPWACPCAACPLRAESTTPSPTPWTDSTPRR